MSLSYNNSILAQTISVSGSNTNVSGVLQVNSVNVSISGHTHTISDITNFKYSVLIGDGSATSYTVTHNLGVSNDVHVSVRDVGTNYYVYPDILYVNTNSIQVIFVSAPTTNQYRVTVIGV